MGFYKHNYFIMGKEFLINWFSGNLSAINSSCEYTWKP